MERNSNLLGQLDRRRSQHRLLGEIIADAAESYLALCMAATCSCIDRRVRRLFFPHTASIR
jgi:hypothetical protein